MHHEQLHYEQYENDRLATQLSRALGWFSVALGAAELLAPQQMARLMGVQARDGTSATFRAFGAREMANGIAILAQPEDAKWLWSRLGGDALGLATLTRAAGDEGANRVRLAFTTAAVMGVAALDVLCARKLSGGTSDNEGFGTRLEREQAVTIRAPLEEVEAGWVKWCASEYARLKKNYAVRFEPAPGARGTEMHLAGGESKGTVREELRRFKQLMETGEIPVSEGPGLWRPAQPPDDADQLKHTAGVL